MDDVFEKTFEAFLDRDTYDQAEEALFSLLRAAFIAGWKAAGGKETDTENVVKMVRVNNKWMILRSDQ
ncbi:MAG: hypothetical protein IK099_09755 [Clostridia bacterium]|nr:hypothetical protein [Clostridia bacterium]